MQNGLPDTRIVERRKKLVESQEADESGGFHYLGFQSAIGAQGWHEVHQRLFDPIDLPIR